MAEIIEENAVLLDKYYDERALSSLPKKGYDPYFQFGLIQWATDLTEMIDGKPSVIETIPSDLAALQNVFFTSEALYAYNDGVIIISTSIDAGEIPQGEAYELSAVGILDSNTNMIAAIGMLPIWVYSNRGTELTVFIRLAKNGAVEGISAKVEVK